MNEKESRRLPVMEQVLAGRLSTREAAQLLGLSQRHIKRLKTGLKKEGASFLAHKNRGRKPAHAISDQTKQTVIELVTTNYGNISYQQISKLLAEHHDINISAKSVSRILKAADLPRYHSRKKTSKCRSRDHSPQ
ncbi:MAG: helix-turn-helix domain containing protein [Firmicutes bacterium]|nr:helix-turn-helix domain containing protein [Bacillota bacterium]